MTCYLRDTNIEGNMEFVRCAETQTQEDVLTDVLLDDEWHLVLFNDNHNTFDHVIDSLMSICGHDALQAEQCALLVHFKGKCAVKSGAYADLLPRCSALLDAGLSAEII